VFTVLHTESSKGWGGQENRILQESLGLAERGVRTILLCQPYSELAQRAQKAGLEVKACWMRKSYDLPAIGSILKIIKAEDINIVNTHSGRDSFLAGIAARLSRRKPVVVRTRHLALPITSKTTYSILPHKIVTVSEYVRGYLIREGIDPEKVVSIPTGVDLRRFAPDRAKGSLTSELGLTEDAPLIGTVAILRMKKGYHVLLDAIPLILKKIPEAVFVFAGDGPQRENISNRIAALNLAKNVILLGLRGDVPDILKSLDLFVLPTQEEALGTAFLEAMAMEKPVIGTDVGGVREVIMDGVNGYLVEPRNPSALAEKAVALLRNKDLAHMMGTEGRRIVESATRLRECVTACSRSIRHCFGRGTHEARACPDVPPCESAPG
jgi:glycosyltransferase involved in cell wall biosynthesis